MSYGRCTQSIAYHGSFVQSEQSDASLCRWAAAISSSKWLLRSRSSVRSSRASNSSAWHVASVNSSFCT
eukprot:scaffold21964_cov118-Isochrysis_galbana.AAC.1